MFSTVGMSLYSGSYLMSTSNWRSLANKIKQCFGLISRMERMVGITPTNLQ